MPWRWPSCQLAFEPERPCSWRRAYRHGHRKDEVELTGPGVGDDVSGRVHPELLAGESLAAVDVERIVGHAVLWVDDVPRPRERAAATCASPAPAAWTGRVGRPGTQSGSAPAAASAAKRAAVGVRMKLPVGTSTPATQMPALLLGSVATLGGGFRYLDGPLEAEARAVTRGLGRRGRPGRPRATLAGPGPSPSPAGDA